MVQRENREAKWEVQFRKGTLELVVLAALKGRKLYGLELLGMLGCFETMTISEGTLYPLMDRLRRDGVVDSTWVQEGQSRPRKYYRLTGQGEATLADLTLRWRNSAKDIESLLNNPGPKKIRPRGE